MKPELKVPYIKLTRINIKPHESLYLRQQPKRGGQTTTFKKPNKQPKQKVNKNKTTQTLLSVVQPTSQPTSQPTNQPVSQLTTQPIYQECHGCFFKTLIDIATDQPNSSTQQQYSSTSPQPTTHTPQPTPPHPHSSTAEPPRSNRIDCQHPRFSHLMDIAFKKSFDKILPSQDNSTSTIHEPPQDNNTSTIQVLLLDNFMKLRVHFVARELYHTIDNLMKEGTYTFFLIITKENPHYNSILTTNRPIFTSTTKPFVTDSLHENIDTKRIVTINNESVRIVTKWLKNCVFDPIPSVPHEQLTETAILLSKTTPWKQLKGQWC